VTLINSHPFRTQQSRILAGTTKRCHDLYKLLDAAETDSGHGGLWTTAQVAKATGRERYVILNDIRSGRIPAVERANIGKTSTYLSKPVDVVKRYEIKTRTRSQISEWSIWQFLSYGSSC